jgi:hypothetical protein
MKRIEKNFEWDNFNVQDLETKHRITEKANIDGQGNIPKTDSSSYSETENEIVLACNTYLERNTDAAGVKSISLKINNIIKLRIAEICLILHNFYYYFSFFPHSSYVGYKLDHLYLTKPYLS